MSKINILPYPPTSGILFFKNNFPHLNSPVSDKRAGELGRGGVTSLACDPGISFAHALRGWHIRFAVAQAAQSTLYRNPCGWMRLAHSLFRKYHNFPPFRRPAILRRDSYCIYITLVTPSGRNISRIPRYLQGWPDFRPEADQRRVS